MSSSAKTMNTRTKKEAITRAAFKLFTENGYENTSVRQIVDEANTSMGNLYFHYPDKLSILKYICYEFVEALRSHIAKVHDMNFSPEVGFALDFRIGYLATLEDPTFSQIFTIARSTPEIHKHSLENKKIRLTTFFDEQISPEELNSLAIAIQGIADSFFEQKRNGLLNLRSKKISNTIIEYSLRLLGFERDQIDQVVEEVDKYIEEKHITPSEYFNFPEFK